MGSDMWHVEQMRREENYPRIVKLLRLWLDSELNVMISDGERNARRAQLMRDTLALLKDI